MAGDGVFGEDHFFGTSGGQGKPAGLNEQTLKSLEQIESESSKVACECNHGLMVEALKKFMFKQQPKK